MKAVVLAASIAAFLGCVPSTNMNKADFERCISMYPDEMKVYRKHGVPESITKYTSAQAANTDDQAGTTWVYNKPKEFFFHFDANGHLLPRTSSKNQTPQ